MNAMCTDCTHLGKACKGEQNTVYTGCIKKEIVKNELFNDERKGTCSDCISH